MTTDEAKAVADALDVYLAAREDEQLFKGSAPDEDLKAATLAARKRFIEILQTGAAA